MGVEEKGLETKQRSGNLGQENQEEKVADPRIEKTRVEEIEFRTPRKNMDSQSDQKRSQLHICVGGKI